MVHHEGTEHHIEFLIGKVELFDHANSEFDRQVAPRGFRAGTGGLLCARINTADASGCANVWLDLNRQGPCAAPNIEHLLPQVECALG